MKKCYFFLLLIGVPFFVSGQTYGNEWINYSQKYYKIKVAKDGIYRIDSLTLADAGIPLKGLNPKNFQLFFKGKEQYIYVQGENDGAFNKNDYIEFYGQHNDGRLDSLVYTGITFVPNPYYSLFNDTSTYFLTWNSSVNNHRMVVQTDTSFSSYIAANYFIAETVNYGSNQYYEGARIPVPPLSANDPHYTQAEGWFNNELDLNQSQTYNLNVSNVYSSGPSAIFTAVIAGESNAGFSPDHEIQISYSWGGPITDTVFGNNFPVLKETYSVAPSGLSGTVSMTFKSIDTKIPAVATIGNTTAISYIYAQYPHTPDMDGASSFTLYVPDNVGGKTYLNLTNFSVSPGDSVRFYDLTNHNRIKVVQAGSNDKVLVPNSGGLKQCYITSDKQAYSVNKLIPVGNTGTFTSYIPSSRTLPPYVIITHPSLWTEASAYASYRSSRYDVVLANVEELYDQFGYGVEKDPLAIRRFCQYAVNTWRVPPAELFIIGKGIHTPLYRHDTAAYKACLVPSFGYPSSDVLLTAGFNKSSSLKPAIPTGRLAAVDGTEVSNYLNKVEIYESPVINPPSQWMKRVIHFCGGSDAAEQNTFLGYLNSYASYIQNPYFGGFVYTFKKTTSDPIQITLADSVTQLINGGVSIMTFFGHASGNNFDESLDAPSDYNNVDKYPFIIANACFSGDIFQPVGEALSSTSEQFVLDQKGSIGFLASDDIGVSGELFNYTNTLYNNIAYSMYRKPIGNCLQTTIAEQGTSDVLERYTCMEMTLHGDPAITLNLWDSLPDYAVTDSSIYFTPANVTTEIDSFKLHVVISNIGEALNQPVQVSLTRYFPNGSDSTYLKTLNHIYYQDTAVFTLAVDKVRGVGLNRFQVYVDPSNLIKELTKTNNQIGAPGTLLWITSGDIIPVLPYQFAIIPGDTVTLKASTGDPNAPLRKYIFQIDTTANFNSPWLKSQIVSAKGGVVCAPSQYWLSVPPPYTSMGGKSSNSFNLRLSGTERAMSLPLFFNDSTVYYWRVKRDTTDTKDFHWEQSSFQYITGKTGWAQAHYYQFVNNQYTYINLNTPRRGWVFSPTGKTLECYTYGVPPYLSIATLESSFNNQLESTLYKLDLTVQGYAGCQYAPGIYVAVIDPVTLEPWSPANYNYGQANYAGNPYGCLPTDKPFIFWDSLVNQQKGLETMLNKVPNGYYILAYTWMEGNFTKWAYPNLKNDFISLGASPAINTYSDTIPWIFFVQKGNPASKLEKVGKNAYDTLHLTTTLTNNEDFGSMTSPLIGPAQKWDSLSWGQHPLVSNAKDSVRLNIIGIDQYGNSKTLISGVPPSIANMYLSSISAKLYPYLQLMMYTKDTVTHTPSQMRKWQVFYTPVPEVAVNPSVYTYYHNDSLNVGDSVYYKTVVQNISNYPIDSMQYNAWVVDAGNALHYVKPGHTKKLNPGDTTIISVKAPTTGYNGNNSVWMEVNPQYLSVTRPEQYHFNNLAKQNFSIIGDKTNPLLDVTFDGIHILNNDIVSARPNILIQVMDENKFLALNDTSDFAVFIRNVNDPTAQHVYFGPQMAFIPAVLPKNSCRINYTPVLQDGTYELTVQAKDRSGNLSASNSYKIDFQVINKAMISNVLNYPNPFSTSTRFVFTLTGSEVPTNFTIQIMTITGRVVREITADELGPLHIGRNITQYAWDGRDQFGDKLANGIYLYRILTELNGQSIDHYSTGADQYFTKGWGKMYLIR